MGIAKTKEFVMAGGVMKCLLSGEQTNGQFCLFGSCKGGNTRTPIRVHAEYHEALLDAAIPRFLTGCQACLGMPRCDTVR